MEIEPVLELISIPSDIESNPIEIELLDTSNVMIDDVEVDTEHPLLEQHDRAEVKLFDSLVINTVDNELQDSINTNIELENTNTEIKESIIKDSIEVESKELAQVTIDGKPINEWLFKNNNPKPNIIEKDSTRMDNRLQTNSIPVKTKPVDILDTIKRYQNVRLDDAKRTSR